MVLGSKVKYINIPFPWILSWKSSSLHRGFYVMRGFHRGLLLLRCAAWSDPTDMDPLDGKLHHQKAAKKWRSTWSLRYFWCGHLSKENSTHPNKKKIKCRKILPSLESWRGLWVLKKQQPLLVEGWPTTTTTTTEKLRDSWILSR